MKRLLFTLLTILTALISCNQDGRKEEKAGTTEINRALHSDARTIHLDYGFNVTIGQEEDLKKFKTYTFFQLKKEDTVLYTDSSLTEYEFGNTLFPIVLKTGTNNFELFFEVNDRPNKNYLKRFFVKDNQLSGQDKLPTFEAKATDINSDGVKEYVGYWDYSQVWGENNDLTAYNPILYYSVTDTGLKLDSVLTRQRNEMIYGTFHGFLFSENIEQPISISGRFEQELKLVNEGK